MPKINKYKYVYHNKIKNKYIARLPADLKIKTNSFPEIELAAKWVDLQLLKLGKKPVNGFYTLKNTSK